MTRGVYSLTFHTSHDEKVYIGSSTDSVESRLQGHRSDLKRQVHFNSHMQRLFNKYGEPEFHILENCEGSSEQQIRLREQGYIDSIDPEAQVNMGPALPNAAFGRHHSIEWKLGNSRRHKGLHHSEEAKQKIRDSNLARLFSEEIKQEISRKISESKIGKKHSRERRLQNSLVHKKLETCPPSQLGRRYSQRKKEK